MKAFIAILVVLVLGVGAYMVFMPQGEPGTSNPAGGTSPAGPQIYTSNAYKVSFEYPGGYRLEERKDGFEGNDIAVITLVESDVVIPDMSEGPPAISLIVVPNPTGMPLDAWIQAKSISNFNLSNDKKLASTTIAGKPAVAYSHSGLYESDMVAVAYSGHIYLFSVGWSDAASHMRTDFQNLLKTVQLK